MRGLGDGRIWLRALLTPLFVLGLAAQENPPATDEVLAALRAQVRQSLEQAPRYSCVLAIHRMQDKVSAGQKMEEHASVEVTYLEGKEHYSWPGEAPFRDDALRDMLVMGLSGSGSFAEHLRSVVLGEHTTFGAIAASMEGGRRVLRIPYQVPAGKSGYLVNLDGQETEAGIRGEITVRPPEMAVMSFSLDAAGLPPGFPATAVSESIDYQIIDQDGGFRIPARASQRMVEAGTDVYTNEIAYQSCRQFQGSSEIRFDDGPGTASPAETRDAQGALPEGVPVELRLRKALAWEKTRTGDLVEAELTRQIKWKGEVLAEAGSRVTGRVVEFKRLSGSASGFVIGLGFTAIESKGKRIPVSMSLESLTDMPKAPRRGIAAAVRGEAAAYERLDRMRPDGTPYQGTGFIRTRADDGGLPTGLATRWTVD